MTDLFLLTKFHPHFSLDALCRSDTAEKHGIRNACPEHLLPNLVKLSQLLGQIESLFSGHRLKLHSGFRSEAVNQRVGGTNSSQHCLGLAADFTCPGFGTPRQVAEKIARSGLEYDQLILEYDRWVHISTAEGKKPTRNQILSINSNTNGYQTGLV